MTSQKAPARARPRLILASALVVVALAGGARAAAQESPPTTAPGDTPDLLVPGDTTPATTAPSAGDSVPTVSVPDGGDDEGGGDGGLDASTKVWLIVIGLLLVAGVTSALTVLYWRHTRPGRVIEDEPEREPRRWPWTRQPEPEQPPDPTLPHPRPEPVAAEETPEAAPHQAEPEAPSRPAQPQPDYWSGV